MLCRAKYAEAGVRLISASTAGSAGSVISMHADQLATKCRLVLVPGLPGHDSFPSKSMSKDRGSGERW
jgi:hypothetical protein